MDLVDPTRVKEHPLGEGGLPRVDVGGDPDVPHPIHCLLPPWLLFLIGPRRGRHRPPAAAQLGAIEDEDGKRAEPVALRAAEGGEEAGGGGSRHRRRRRIWCA